MDGAEQNDTGQGESGRKLVVSPKDAAKRAAAEAAADQVADGMVVGLGTGSTVRFLLERLAKRIQNEGLKIRGVATSRDTMVRAEALRIPMLELDQVDELALAIDGADEVDPRKHLIKGGGGALTREKLVALAAKRFVVVADIEKQVDLLGRAFPLPIEVLPFGWTHTSRRLAALGFSTQLRRQEGGEPWTSDNGNLILDCSSDGMADPPGMARQLDAVSGVVEHGLFCAMADEVILAHPDGSIRRV